MTPTLSDPFDPLPIYCNLSQKKIGIPNGKYDNPARYSHKKLLQGRDNEFCSYKLSEYADPQYFG